MMKLVAPLALAVGIYLLTLGFFRTVTTLLKLYLDIREGMPKAKIGFSFKDVVLNVAIGLYLVVMAVAHYLTDYLNVHT